MKKQVILITGGAGFIGSNFIPYFLKKNPKYQVVNLDMLTYAGNLHNLREVENNEDYTFIQGDINNRELVEHLFRAFDIRGVIHFAAESHVDNSIKNPDIFLTTNVHGTFTLVDVAKNYWLGEPFRAKQGYESCRFHHISTDEVYGTLGDKGYFTEETPYAPNSPYSASKASSDLIVRSYYHTYGLNVVTTNCSNNYGPKQHDEKLIPTIIRKALRLEPIPIYGDGKNVRDWLYVEDHCSAVDLVFHQGKSGQTYNIGGSNEKNNVEVAQAICRILDEVAAQSKDKSSIKTYEELITFVQDRPGHDKRYAIDATKIKSELDWWPRESFEQGLRKTVLWYLKTTQTKRDE